MRSVLAFLLGVVALVLTAAATPALWLERNVVDEAGYVRLVDQLGRDDAFQDALAAALVDTVLSGADLPDAASDRARPVLLQAAGGLTRLPGYADAWTETNRRTHARVFAEDAQDEVTIDIAPLARLLADTGSSRIGAQLPVPSSVPVVVGGADERAAVDDVATLDPRAYYATGAAVLAAVLCVAAARRRSTATLWLGLGVLVVAGLLKAAAVLGLPVAAARADAPSDLGDRVIDLLERAAGSSFDGWLLALAGLGVVMFALGLIGRLVGRRRAPA